MSAIKEKVEKIINELEEYRDRKICITSSFQTHSLPLLHIVTRKYPEIPVLFIDTGFHFPETYQFRNQICLEWDLNMINIRSEISKHQQMNADNQFLYNSNTEYCCHINKVVPLDKVLKHYDVWIAGLRKDQTKFRTTLTKEEILDDGMIKYHPILDWNSKDIYEYRVEHNLPSHPLEEKGYFSIGCLPCTKSALEEDRDARWFGQNKTECGIHLNKE